MSDFPRGGAASTALTSLELRDATEKAAKELFALDQPQPDAPEKKKQKKRKANDKEVARKKTANQPEKDVKNEKKTDIYPLSFKKLTAGFTLLGVVKQINELDIVVSLPHQMTGSVSITEVSDKALPCIAISAEKEEKRRKIELSFNPSRLNATVDVEELCIGMNLSAAVKSVEDNGYIMDFGFKGKANATHGFLNKKHASALLRSFGETEKGALLSVGQVIYCTILSIDATRRTIALSAEPEAIAKAVVPVSHTLSFPSIKPGLLLSTRVKSTIDEAGLCVSLFGLFDGFLELAHLGDKAGDGSGLDATFKEGGKVQARVLYVDNQRKRVGLTLNQSLVSWTTIEAAKFLAACEVGSVYEEAEVVRVDGDVGLVVKVGEGCHGYVHVTRISDKEDAKIDSKKHAPGTKHTVRVLGFDFCDHLLQLTMKPSVLATPFLRHSEVKPGMLVTGTVTKVDTYGVFINLAEGIGALIPNAHLAEGTVSNPAKKFKVGSTVKGRVLSSEPEAKRISVTLKQSLVESELPIVAAYDPSLVGTIVDCVITSIPKHGVYVSFYNKVTGFCPTNQLSTHHVTDASVIFSVGQVVKGRITNVDVANKRVNVSFKQATIVDAASSITSAQAGLTPGQVVSGATVVNVFDGYALVELKGTGGVNAFLYKQHLSDHIGHIDALFAGIKKDQVLGDLVVTQTGKKCRVSAKHSLVQYAKANASGTEKQVGEVVPGFVTKIKDDNVTIEFVGDENTAVAKARGQWVSGQTVFCVVDKKKGTQYDVSIKPAQLAKLVDVNVAYLEGLFAEVEKLQQLSGGSKKKKDLDAFVAKYPLGKVVKGVVKQKAPTGYLIDVENGSAAGLLAVDVGATVALGSEIQVRVVDLDLGKKALDLRLVGGGEEKVKADDKKVAQVIDKREAVPAVVAAVKGSYVVLVIPSLGHRVAFAPVQSINSISLASHFRVDQQVKVVLLKTGAKEGLTLPRLLASVPETIDIAAVELETKVKEAKANASNKLVINSLNESVTYVEDLKPGLVVKAKIVSFKQPNKMMVELGDNLKGQVRSCEIFDDLSEIKDPKKPFEGYTPGQVKEFKVIGVSHDGDSKFAGTKKVPMSKMIVDLTARPSEMNNEKPGLVVFPQSRYPITVAPGSKYVGFVSQITDDGLWVTLGTSLLGRVAIFEISQDASIMSSLNKHYPIGTLVEVLVLNFKKIGQKVVLDLSIRGANAPEGTYPMTMENLKPGQKLVAKIIRVGTTQGYFVALGDKLNGKISLSDIVDEPVPRPTDKYKVGDYVGCRVVEADEGTGTIYLTMRPSIVNAKNPDVVPPFKNNFIVKGYIKNISDAGIFVDIGYGYTAFVYIKDIHDEYIAEWKTGLNLGDIVTGKILSVDAGNRKVKMTLKKAELDPNYVHVRTGDQSGIADMKVGMKVAGTILAINDYGVHIKVDDKNVKGLCHISQLSDKPISKIESLYSIGDPVMAKVLKVDIEKKRVTFGLKASLFNSDDAQNEDDDDEEDDEDGMDVDEDEDDEDAKNDDDDDEDDEEEGDDDEDDEDEDEDEDEDDDMIDDVEEEQPSSKRPKTASSSNLRKLAPLDLGGAGWGDVEDSDDENVEEDDSDDEDEPTNNESKKSKRAKKRAKQEEEDRIAQQELELLETKAPDSAEAFERILMGSPNSSFLWIKFMAFHLQMAEIQKAREVGERALKTINFREPQELINVWVALLNLENTYGDRESLMKLFERAVSFNEPKTMYLNLANIYERSENFEELDALFKVMVKRFKESCKIWVANGLSLLKRGNVPESRKVLQRSLLSLAKRKHLKVVCKFAQMEFKHGEAERGRTLFEGIVSHHPKRLDMWSVYLDMEIRHGDLDNIRRLFERCIALKLSSKKMKFLFKKYLEFEKTKGTPEGVKHVKQAAMEYVERISRD
ncbi:TPR-like protein [Rhizoclosmatium globosum]|uniref:TPR-like protein n=1 Tax=Rhizoclosmatium globosum TaxID=329046 RepID=A0A1Y2B8L8_9FUNG|nr:TPR-like protein [Rhizoclosmatium globosum]|eukprot:ORY31169.1 TPR-like protein [Rhizoclosmatium globosum]